VNRLEERLRDAFGAAADTVRAESVSGLRARPTATRPRRLAPLAAAVAVAVVVIGASVSAPLLLARGHHNRASSTAGATSSPAPSAGSSGAALVVPMVTGFSVREATATLQTVGLRSTVASEADSAVPAGAVITQDPAPGTHVPVSAIVTLTVSTGASPSVTYTLQPSRLVTIRGYGVTLRIPQDWRQTRGLGPVVGYNGTSGWVQVQAVAEPAGLHRACTDVAAHDFGQSGRRAYISYRSIGGRRGCEIVPVRVHEGTALPMIAALVEYRAPIRDGANFLLISADPATMVGIMDSIQLRR
jgi:hypothetical protein